MRLKHNFWRGNVRELFNVLERAAIMAQGEAIRSEHLLLDDDNGPAGFAFGDRSSAGQSIAAGHREPIARPTAGARNSVSMRAMEEQLIFTTLEQTNNNRTMAAKLLGISVRTLRNKLKLYRERTMALEV